MAGVGEATQNAHAERLMRTIKEEEVNLSEYRDYYDARRRIGPFLDEVYQHKRIHSALGYLTPVEFEEQYHARARKNQNQSSCKIHAFCVQLLGYSTDKTFHACQIPLGLVETLIKSCTQEKDDVLILFGGSGSELVLCQKLKRNFVSCEIHPEYYKMIQERLKQNGDIPIEYRLEFVQKKKSNGKSVALQDPLFDTTLSVTPNNVIREKRAAYKTRRARKHA